MGILQCAAQPLARYPCAMPIRTMSSSATAATPENHGSKKKADSSDVEVRRKRLLYHCKQRGILELDIVLGGWARANIHNLSSTELDHLEELVSEESCDLNDWLVAQRPYPNRLNTQLINKIREHARSFAAERDRLAPNERGGNQ